MDEEDTEVVKINKPKKKTLLEKYDILIDHLSFEYISECKNTKELERIITILRSGEEGVYPDLTKHAEDRLTILKPSSSLLRKTEPVLKQYMLEPQVRKELENDINNWRQEMKHREKDLTEGKISLTSELFAHPDIREVEERNVKSTRSATTTRKAKRISSCDYAAWDKFDADTEINRIDLQDERRQIEAKEVQRRQREAVNRGREVPKEVIVNELSLTGTEIDVMAAQEREKGNEAFRVGDYEEALQRYNASIAIDSNPITYNNRAMTLIKLCRYEDAIKDCNTVLTFDHTNVKALLRRGLSLEHIEKRSQALADYESALKLEPDNRMAVAAVKKLRKPSQSIKHRMKITEEHLDANTNCVQSITPTNNRDCVTLPKPSCKFTNAKMNICFCDRAPGASHSSTPLPHVKSDYCLDFGSVQQPSLAEKHKPYKSASNIKLRDSETDTITINNPKSIFSCVSKPSKPSSIIIEEIPNDTGENKSGFKTELPEKYTEKVRSNAVQNAHIENKMESKKPTIFKDSKSNNDTIVQKLIDDKIETKRTTILKDSKNRNGSNAQMSIEDNVILKFDTSLSLKAVEEFPNNDKKQLINLEDKDMEVNKNFDDINTPYEYFRTWQSIKGDDHLKLHARLLRSINPDKLDTYIGNKLDSSMLSVILRCLRDHFGTVKDLELLHRFLSALITVERFDILNMFIDESDKKVLEELLQRLEENNVGNIRSLRESYNIKI